MHFVIVILVISILYILYCIWKRLQIYRLRSQLGLKGPKPHFLFGNLHDILKSKHKEQPMMILKDWRKLYGDIFGYYVGPKLSVFVADLDMIRDVLVKKFDCFVDRMRFAFDDPSPICHNIVFLKGDKWKTIRNSISPTFTISKVKQMSYIVNEKIDSFMENMERHELLGDTFDIYNDFQALTLDVIGRCAFAMPVDCQTNHKEPFLLSVQEIFRLLDMRNFPLVKLAIVLPELKRICSKLREYTRLNDLEQMLCRHLHRVVQERKETLKTKGCQVMDVLQTLLEQQSDKESESKRKWKLTDEVVVGNAYIFLLAGYETTSTALGFTAWLLAKHKDVQKRLQEEIAVKLVAGNV